uniref:Fic family protein n=1 Tax=Ligilactobacillus saerimneri TaxID=228229 RepID=UPI00242C6741
TKPTAMDYAQLLDSLNYLHPFREGNGRATKAFIQLLAANHGQELRFNRQDELVIRALTAADLAVLADFIQLKPAGSKQAVIQKISAELEKKGQHYQTYRPPVNGQF